MNHVTFETAKRLKTSGFPKPEFKVGQLWCNEYGAYTFIVKNDGSENGSDNFFFCTSLMTARTERIIPVNTDAYFVPAATDILKELGHKWTLRFIAERWHCESETAIIPGIMNFTGASDYSHESPAEAASMAFLAMNEKK